MIICLHTVSLFAYLPLLSIRLSLSRRPHSCFPIPFICLSVQPSISRHLYICLLSQYLHLYFKGLFFRLSSHAAARRHQGWAGTPGSLDRSQLEPVPGWVDNVFPQSGHCGTVRPEQSIVGKEEMTVHSYS